jgi:hypothetical protein
MSQVQVEAALNSLVSAGQNFLWKEWLKAKREAIYGDPYDRLSHKAKVWYAKINYEQAPSQDGISSN